MNSIVKKFGRFVLVLAPLTTAAQIGTPDQVNYLQGVPYGYHIMTLPLPQQVLMCDLAGVGRVLESTTSKVDLELTEIWHGSSATNKIAVQYNMKRLDNLPATNTMVMFFATTNLWWTLQGSTNYPPPNRLYSFAFVTNRPPVYACSVTNWIMINDAASISAIEVGNSNLCSFALNLLNAARDQQDSSLFFSLIVNGSTNTSNEVRGSARSYVFLLEKYIPREVVDRVYQK